MTQKRMAGKTSDTGELRHLAESKLIERKKKTGPLPEMESEARRLVHELQVHQIELEMQNEELIQARVKSEAALDQYTNLYDFAPVGYVTLARDGRIQNVNLAGAKLLGADRSTVISRQFGQFVAFDSRPIFSNFLHNIFAKEGANKEVCELLLQGEGAATYWVHIEAVADDPQSEVRRVAVVDITERKETQDKLARANQLLEETGRLGKIGGWEIDLKTMEPYFSAETFNIYDLPGPTPLKVEDGINFYAPESRPVIRLAVKNAIEKHIPYDLELPFITAKGQNLWVRTQGHVEVKDGQAVRLYGTLQDISERKMAEKIIQNHAVELEHRVQERTAELNKLNFELQHANNAKDEFLANMSHELRTPLNSILGFSESLLEQTRGPLNEKQEQYVGLIHSSGEHLLNLINDILEVSKIEARKFDLYPDIVSVKEVCESSLNFVKVLAVKKAISIGYANEQSILTLQADPQRLKQILVNLLNNAVKFTPERGKVLLEVKTSPEKDRIQFSVKDNGIGITKENLSKLFVPFTQLDSSLSRQYEGTGLGLVLILKLTEMHGGSVKVESEPGVGSRFTVILPWSENQFTNPNEHLTSAMPVEPVHAAISNTGERGKILLAEDNESNVLTIQEYLSDHGYEVMVAHDGLEAIDMAEDSSPDIFLMDIQMPKMDGLEAISRLRSDPRFASTPIIALTALVKPGDRKRCLEAGANEYMSKPVSLKGLVKTIHTFLAKKG